MQDFVIRKAKIKDLEEIQRLNHELFVHDREYDPLLDMNWSFEEGETYFKNRINGDGAVFVAQVNGKVVGYLAGGMMRPYSYRKIKKMTELENTLVKEEFRGQGIGEKLFDKFIECSKVMGAERIKVSVSFDNERGIKFYKRVGFIPYAIELEYEIK